MSREYKLELPIYYTVSEKKILVGMNWYRNAHNFLSDRAKKHYCSLIKNQLWYLDKEHIKIDRYNIKYKLYTGSNRPDMMNIVAVIDKYAQDAIKDAGLTIDDSVKHNRKVSVEFVEVDKNNPRIEMEIMEAVEE